MSLSRPIRLPLWLAAFCLAFLVASPYRATGQGVTVTATAYSCQPHPANRMANTPGSCEVLRWGGDINSPGMACPVEWRDRVYQVPGYGALRCDDTGARDWFRGLPHIDIRTATYAEAAAFGVQQMTITVPEPQLQPAIYFYFHVKEPPQ